MRRNTAAAEKRDRARRRADMLAAREALHQKRLAARAADEAEKERRRLVRAHEKALHARGVGIASRHAPS